jgi:hypothetical protein
VPLSPQVTSLQAQLKAKGPSSAASTAAAAAAAAGFPPDTTASGAAAATGLGPSTASALLGGAAQRSREPSDLNLADRDQGAAGLGCAPGKVAGTPVCSWNN